MAFWGRTAPDGGDSWVKTPGGEPAWRIDSDRSPSRRRRWARDKSERRSGLACMGDIWLVRSCSVFLCCVFKNNFYWSTVALQHGVSCSYTEKSTSHTYIFAFQTSPLGWPSAFPGLYSISSLASCFIYSVSPNLPVPPTSPSPLGMHIFVLYICVCVSALQLRSSIPSF